MTNTAPAVMCQHLSSPWIYLVAPIAGSLLAQRSEPMRLRGRILFSADSERGLHHMNTREFIEKLRVAQSKRLIFTNSDGDTIHTGYHLTEIKAARFDTVDCGGQVNRWPETIFQLWVPESADDEYMNADKFLRIYEKVSASIPVDENAEVGIEYGDENFFPTLYRIDSISPDKHALRVLLQEPSTTCKARERAIDSNAERCCA